MNSSLGCFFSSLLSSRFDNVRAGLGGPAGFPCSRTSPTCSPLLTTAPLPWCTASLLMWPYQCCCCCMCQLFSGSQHAAQFHPGMREKLASFCAFTVVFASKRSCAPLLRAKAQLLFEAEDTPLFKFAVPRSYSNSDRHLCHSDADSSLV